MLMLCMYMLASGLYSAIFASIQNQIQKDTIVKKLGKVINPSQNTNPFNHNMKYIKLYTSVKDGIGNKDEFGQLINAQYLDDVFNFATSLPALTRKVRVDLGRKELLVMREVQVFNYANDNVALNMPATQSSNYKGSGPLAKDAVNGVITDYSHTDDNVSEYHIRIPAINPLMYHFYTLTSHLLCFLRLLVGGRLAKGCGSEKCDNLQSGRT
jgi:hypothetical protein